MSPKNTWRDTGYQCDKHGITAQILNNEDQKDGICGYDGDECRCEKGCRGWLSVFDYDDVSINWEE